MKAWYQEQSRKLRSSSESRQWLLGQVKGEVWQPFQKVWESLSCIDTLEQLGMDTLFFQDAKEMDENHPKVIEQDEFATLLGRFMLNFLGARDRRLLFLTEGWTGQQVKFFDTCDRSRNEAAARLRAQSVAFDALCRQTSRVCKAMAARSIFQTALVIQLREVCESSAWQVTEELSTLAFNRCSGLLQSKVAEDVICKCRKLEKPSPNPTQIPCHRFWKYLIDSQVTSELYRFKEPLYRDLVIPEEERELPKCLFKPDFQNSPAKLRTIVSNRQKPAWPTTTVPGMPVAYADMHAMTVAYELNDWSVLNTTYFSALGEAGNVALKRNGDDKWYFSFGGGPFPSKCQPSPTKQHHL